MKCVVLCLAILALVAGGGRLSAEEILAVSFGQVDKIFGEESRFTELQKDQIWDERFKGRYVVWAGLVYDIDTRWFGGILLYFNHRKESSSYQVRVAAEDKYKDFLLAVQKGQLLKYKARLVERGGTFSTYRLDDCSFPEW
ncbi:MAG: hypothetical protein J3T61_04000 [Candidatus Brocadiales bacterium]|nr:hypothetical protein [Candidatus Bathyanammoxibius sp.]